MKCAMPFGIAMTLQQHCLRGAGDLRGFLAIPKHCLPLRPIGKASAFEASDAERISKLPMNDVLKAIAKGVGLDVLMGSRGFSQAQINTCLSDPAAQKQVAAMSNEAWSIRKINGTPSFLINGNAFEGPGSWPAVEAGLKAALAAK